MKYWSNGGWLVIEKNAIIGELFGNFRISGFDDKITIYDRETGKVSVVRVERFDENEIFGSGREASLSIRVSPLKKLAFVTLDFQGRHNILLAREGVNGEFRPLSNEIAAEKSWMPFLDFVLGEFEDGESVYIKAGDNSLTVQINGENGIQIVCTYSSESREWRCRAEDIEFDWGKMNAEIIPDVEAIREFLEMF